MMQKYLLGGEAFNPDKWSIIVKKTGFVPTEGFSTPVSHVV